MESAMKIINKMVLGVLFVLFLTNAAFGRNVWKFMVTCDSRGYATGVNEYIMTEMVNQAIEQEVDLVLFPGDLVGGILPYSQGPFLDQLINWRNVVQPAVDAGIKIYSVRGNHDHDPDDSVAIWKEVIVDAYDLPDNGPDDEKYLTYSVKHKNALLVCFDQYVHSHRNNQSWFDEQLAANKNVHIFAVGHEPAFKAMHSSCMDDYFEERDAFWQSLEDAGARVYFCGHDHFYDHAVVDGDGDPNNDIHQYIVGTAGAPLYSWTINYDGDNSGYTVENIYHAKAYGYVLVEVQGLKVTLTWMQRTGTNVYAAKNSWSYTAKTNLDLNDDGIVDMKDLWIISSHWLETGE
jgi:predicted phosphodiesterase